MGGKEIDASEMERRRFLQGALAVAAIPPVCCRAPELPAASVAFEPGRIRVNLTLAPELRKPGAAFSVVDEARKVNMLLIHSGHAQYAAIDRTCTHGGAMCTYNAKRHTLQCTSLNHAEYDLRGTLLHGRTHGNLRTYRTAVAGPAIEIDLESRA